MKKIIAGVLTLLTIFSVHAQSYTARMDVSAQEILSPGSNQSISITITNTSKSAFVIGKSEYALVMHYQKSTAAGQVFTQRYRLPETLQPGKSYTFARVSFKSPIHPGDYPIRITFEWGNQVIVERIITFIVEPNYYASISAKRLTLPNEPDTDLQFSISNTGSTAWPEGKYGLRFQLRKAPGAATRQDQSKFNTEPRQFESWDFEPGESDDIILKDFRLPSVQGDYVVRVQLLLNGNIFEADGAARDFTFKIKN